MTIARHLSPCSLARGERIVYPGGMADSCLFCGIIEGSVPGTIVHEDENVVAFEDVNPAAPVHLLVVPREHVERAIDAEDRHAELIGRMFLAAGKLIRDRKIEDGARLVMNNGRGAGQSVFHIHLHVLGGRSLAWPPG